MIYSSTRIWSAACPPNHAALHTSEYVSIRQHTSAYVSTRQHTSAYVSTRQHTSAHVSTRQHTSAYVRIRQHTSAYASASDALIPWCRRRERGHCRSPPSRAHAAPQQCTPKTQGRPPRLHCSRTAATQACGSTTALAASVFADVC